MTPDQQAKTMYLGQHGQNLLLRLNKEEQNLVIELDEAGMITLIEKMMEIRGHGTLLDWVNTTYELSTDVEADDEEEVE